MEDVNKFIEARRQALGWTDTYMARRVGLSVSEYCDIEWHPDELATVVSLMHVRRLSEAIDVPVHALFELELMADAPHYGCRPEYIKDALAKRGVTAEQMADAIGFHDDFGRGLLMHFDFLELYPYEVLADVARYLDVPPQHLLGKFED